jgi:hypothetical protein
MKHVHRVVVHYSTVSPNPSSLRIAANASSIDCPRPALSSHTPTQGGDLTLSGEGNAVAVLGQSQDTWTIVDATPSLCVQAIRLVRVHGLLAADGLQLAAALAWAENRPSGREFVCLNPRLREAARREGFLVMPREIKASLELDGSI